MAEAGATRYWGVTRDDAGWCARLWAPGAQQVTIEVGGASHPLSRGEDDSFETRFHAPPGSLYRFTLDGAEVIDPASRAQPEGLFGPSALVDLSQFAWQHPRPARPWHEAVICELHIGTFTPEGTYAAAAERLADLADLGFTAIELMPVNQIPGEYGWGYDTALPFAPHHAYGTPEDLCRLVDHAHGLGLSVLLDVVYNHFGPEGVDLHRIAPEFFDQTRSTPWGPAIDFSRAPVRDFFQANAAMWLTDYRFDGFRFDATHQIRDTSRVHILDEIAAASRAVVDGPVHLVAEDERNDPARRAEGVLDAQWNDDYHHAVHCALTNEAESYYRSFAVDPIADLVLALRDGQVRQGQDRAGSDIARGKPSGHLPPSAFVNANQTHDQVGNRALGDRLVTLAGEDATRAMHAMLLCLPFVPMLFMGEERGETNPFLFFADPGPGLAQAYRDGRRAEFAGFSAFAGTEVPDPTAPATRDASRLGWAEDARARGWLDLTKRCLAFRAAHVTPRLASGLPAPPEVRRTGPRSVAADWTFAAGVLRIAANLGAAPDDPPGWTPTLAEGDPATSAFAFGVTT